MTYTPTTGFPFPDRIRARSDLTPNLAAQAADHNADASDITALKNEVVNFETYVLGALTGGGGGTGALLSSVSNVVTAPTSLDANGTATTAAALWIRSGRGSHAAPLALQASDPLGRVGFGAQYDSTVGHIRNDLVQLKATAAETHDATHAGTYASLLVTPVGTTTPVEAQRWNADGSSTLSGALHALAGASITGNVAVSAGTVQIGTTSVTGGTVNVAGAVTVENPFLGLSFISTQWSGGTSAVQNALDMRGSRGTGLGAWGALQLGDRPGSIHIGIDDGTTLRDVAMIQYKMTENAVAGTNYGGKWEVYTQPNASGFTSTGVLAATFDQDGSFTAVGTASAIPGGSLLSLASGMNLVTAAVNVVQIRSFGSQGPTFRLNQVSGTSGTPLVSALGAVLGEISMTGATDAGTLASFTAAKFQAVAEEGFTSTLGAGGFRWLLADTSQTAAKLYMALDHAGTLWGGNPVTITSSVPSAGNWSITAAGAATFTSFTTGAFTASSVSATGAISAGAGVFATGGPFGLDFIGTEYGATMGAQPVPCTIDLRATRGTDLAHLSHTLSGDTIGGMHIGGSFDATLVDIAQIYNVATQDFSGDLSITQANTLTNASSDTTADKITSTAHGLSNGQSIVFAGLTNTTGISDGTYYFVVNKTTNDFQVALTAGGAAIDLTGTNDTGLVVSSGASGNQWSFYTTLNNSNYKREVVRFGHDGALYGYYGAAIFGTTVLQTLGVLGTSALLGAASFGSSAQLEIDASGNLTTSGTITETVDSASALADGLVLLQRSRASGAVSSGDALGTFVLQGHNGSGFATGAQMFAQATETWTTSAEGAKLVLQVKANGSTSLTTALTLDQDQSATFAGAVTASSTLTVTGAATLTDLAVTPSTVLSTSLAKLVGVAGAPGFNTKRINGSLISPTPVTSTQNIALFQLGGQYDTTVGHTKNGALISAIATTTWSATNVGGAKLVFQTLGDAAASLATALTLDQDQSAAFAGAFGFNGATPAVKSGWGTPTNTFLRTTFDTTTVSLANLAARVGALITDLKAVGVITA